MLIGIALAISGCNSKIETSPEKEKPEVEKTNELRMANYDSGGMIIADDENGHYYVSVREDGDSNIKYIDYENSSEFYLCNRVECKHSDDTCNSWLPYTSGFYQICLDKEQLYIIHSGADEIQMNKDSQNAQEYVMIMDLSGANKKKIHVFKDAQGATSIGSVVFTDTSIFMIKQKVEIEKNIPTTYFYLTEMEKENGGTKEILRLDFNYPNIVDVKDNKIIITEVEEKENVGFVFSAYSIDVESYNINELYSWDNQVCFGRFYNGELYIFNRMTSMISCVDVETKEEIQIGNVSPEQSIVGIGVIGFVDDFVVGATHNDNGTGKTYMMNLKTKSVSHPNMQMETEFPDLKGNIMRIISSYKDKFIVINEINYQLVDYPQENGKTMKMQTLQYKYGVIDKEDYINNTNTCTPLEIAN